VRERAPHARGGPTLADPHSVGSTSGCLRPENAEARLLDVMRVRAGSRAFLVLPLALLLAGCQVLQAPWTIVRRIAAPAFPMDTTQQDLRGWVAEYAVRFVAVVTSAADEIAARTDERTLRRNTLLWKLRMTHAVERAAFAEDPQAAYVSVLAISFAMHHYLREGEGRDVFGEHQHIAREASERLVEDARAIGARYLTDRQLARLVREVEELAEARPIRGVFVPETIPYTLGIPVDDPDAFGWLMRIPMAPVRALEGIDTTAQAVLEFNQTAAHFVAILELLPQQIRWQSELLLYDVEDRDMVERTLASLERVSESALAFAETAQTLPERLREESVQLLEQIEASQGELRATLEATRATFADAEPLSAALGSTAGHLERAGLAWRGLVEEVRRERERDPDAPAPRPFDIVDYERAVQQVTSAAVELRQLVSELRGLSEAELAVALEQASTLSGSLVDRAAWRGLQLLLGFFALLFLYRRLEAWLARRPGRAGRSA
jgi:hypothetical protein